MTPKQAEIDLKRAAQELGPRATANALRELYTQQGAILSNQAGPERLKAPGFLKLSEHFERFYRVFFESEFYRF